MTTQTESISDLRMQRDAARAEAADLRRQLETAQLQRDAARAAGADLQAERVALRALLETERHRNAIAKDHDANLRRQLAEAQADRTEVLRALDIVIAERDVAHAEIDDLRRQVVLANNWRRNSAATWRAQRHARLQELYCNLVRQRLAASSWIVVRGKETRR